MNRHSEILRFDRIVVERVTYAPNLYMPPHTDKLSRISIILDGTMNEAAGLEDVSASAGGLVIKPRHAVHENIFGAKPVKLLTIGFEDDSLFSSHFTKWQYIHHPKIYVEAIRMWATLLKIKNETDLLGPLGVFSAMALPSRDQPAKVVFWTEQLKELLARDLSERENITALSKKLSLHRVYMTRAFKKEYGVSPVEFRKYTKIATAFIDLALTSKKLASVAYDAGFSDQSHMNREFRLHAGCTPASFRKIMKGN